jgi:hypothetical protein
MATRLPSSTSPERVHPRTSGGTPSGDAAAEAPSATQRRGVFRMGTPCPPKKPRRTDSRAPLAATRHTATARVERSGPPGTLHPTTPAPNGADEKDIVRDACALSRRGCVGDVRTRGSTPGCHRSPRWGKGAIVTFAAPRTTPSRPRPQPVPHLATCGTPPLAPHPSVPLPQRGGRRQPSNGGATRNPGPRTPCMNPPDSTV